LQILSWTVLQCHFFPRDRDQSPLRVPPPTPSLRQSPWCPNSLGRRAQPDVPNLKGLPFFDNPPCQSSSSNRMFHVIPLTRSSPPTPPVPDTPDFLPGPSSSTPPPPFALLFAPRPNVPSYGNSVSSPRKKTHRSSSSPPFSLLFSPYLPHPGPSAPCSSPCPLLISNPSRTVTPASPCLLSLVQRR